MNTPVDDGDGPGGPSGTNPGNDGPIVGTTGDDSFFWTLGDPSEVIDGGGGGDTLTATTGTGADTVSISAVAPFVGALHADLVVNGVTAVDMVNISTVNLKTLDGADNITIGNLAGSGVGTVNVALAGANGQPDGAADTLTLAAPDTGSQMFAFESADGHGLQVLNMVNGVWQTINVSGFDSSDTLTFQGGAGADSFSVNGAGAAERIFINGGGGADNLTGGAGNETLSGGTGNDTIQAGAGNIVTGDEGDDVLTSAQGAIVSGGAGNDTIHGAFNDVIQGGDGNDSMTAGDSTRADGGIGNDTITADNHDNGTLIAGGDGNDSLGGIAGNVTFHGDAGDDAIVWNMIGAQTAHTVVDGGADNDTLTVNGPQDDVAWTISLTNSGGFDNLHLFHNDQGAGSDNQPNVIDSTLFITNTEHLVIEGGRWNDDITIGDQSGTGVQSIDVDLGFWAGRGDQMRDNVTLVGSSAGDNVSVSNVLTASGANQVGDIIVSGLPETVTLHHVDPVTSAFVQSDDVLIQTGAGDDTINLQGFNDLTPNGAVAIDAGAGNNTIFGGTGSFAFEFHAGSGSHDVIWNFRSADMQDSSLQHDFLDLSSLPDQSLGQMVADGHLYMNGNDTIITDGAGTFLTLKNFAYTSLHSGDVFL